MKNDLQREMLSLISGRYLCEEALECLNKDSVTHLSCSVLDADAPVPSKLQILPSKHGAENYINSDCKAQHDFNTK